MWGKIWKVVKKVAKGLAILNREDVIDVNEADAIKGEVDRIDVIVEAGKTDAPAE